MYNSEPLGTHESTFFTVSVTFLLKSQKEVDCNHDLSTNRNNPVFIVSAVKSNQIPTPKIQTIKLAQTKIN